MTHATLIQASINRKTGNLIFTFYVTYERKSWLNVFGNLFSKRLEQSEYVTVAANDGVFNIMLNLLPSLSFNSYKLLRGSVQEQVDLAALTLTAALSGRTYGKVTQAHALHARELWGNRMQDVLKIYDVGEYHRPPGATSRHDSMATDNGWA